MKACVPLGGKLCVNIYWLWQIRASPVEELVGLLGFVKRCRTSRISLLLRSR